MTRQLRYVERADFVVQQSIYTCLTSRMIGDFRSACISVLKQTSGIFHKVTQHVLAKWSIKEPRFTIGNMPLWYHCQKEGWVFFFTICWSFANKRFVYCYRTLLRTSLVCTRIECPLMRVASFAGSCFASPVLVLLPRSLSHSKYFLPLLSVHSLISPKHSFLDSSLAL